MTKYSENDKKVLALFGKNLKKLRLNKSVSQEKLAELCNLHRTYIGSAERGERNVSLLNIVKIAKALGVSPCDFLV